MFAVRYRHEHARTQKDQQIYSAMRLRLRFGCALVALGLAVRTAVPLAAQNHAGDKPSQEQRQAPRQEPRQAQQRGRKPQGGRLNTDRSRNNISPNRSTEMKSPNGGNRPPTVDNPPARPKRFQDTKRFQDLTTEEKRRVLLNQDKFNHLSPQKQQEMREAARNWAKLTTAQQNHIKNDLLPVWKQLSAVRRNAIRNRLGVLQNMPEWARNQHLNDPDFTRGMSEEDKALLRDLGHMHVGAPDRPND